MNDLTNKEKKKIRKNVRRDIEKVARYKRLKRQLMQPIVTRPIPGGDNDVDAGGGGLGVRRL